jgi:putative NADH-flavin reductase
MRIVVFGATGRTGRPVVEQALERGHDVAAFVRTPGRLEAHPRLTEAQGDALDAEAVSRSVRDVDAAISALGLDSLDRPTDHSDATAGIVRALNDARVRRLSIVSNQAIFFSKVAPAYAPYVAEHRRNVETLRESDLDWIALAPPLLTDDPPSGAYRVALDAPAGGDRISRADLATALLDSLDRTEWQGHAVGISSKE